MRLAVLAILAALPALCVAQPAVRAERAQMLECKLTSPPPICLAKQNLSPKLDQLLAEREEVLYIAQEAGRALPRKLQQILLANEAAIARELARPELAPYLAIEAEKRRLLARAPRPE